MEEVHEKRFTGWWIPEYVVVLLEQEIINVKELILLANIDSLARNEKGCFASNQFLGSKVQVGADRAGRMLSHLQKLHLIHQVCFDGRKRYLETYWSKNPAGLNRNTGADPTETPGQTRQKHRGRPDRNTVHNNIGNKKEDILSKLFSSDGECSFSDGRKGKRTATPWDYKATAELYKVVSSHIKVNCTANNKQWANQFRLMRTRDRVSKKDIRAAIEWYKDNIGSEYMVEAFSASTFRKKYMNGQIPGAMKRNGYNNTSNPDDPRTELQRTVDRVLEHLRENGTWHGDYYDPPKQPDIDRTLVALGKRKGEISPGDCMN